MRNPRAGKAKQDPELPQLDETAASAERQGTQRSRPAPPPPGAREVAPGPTVSMTSTEAQNGFGRMLEMVARQAPKRVGLRFVPTRVVSWDHSKLAGAY